MIRAKYCRAARRVNAIGAEQTGVLSGAVAEPDPYPIGVWSIAECVRALGGNVREQLDPYALTRELGIQQMQQQILIADSIRASTLLWRAAVPVLRKILTDYGPAGCERLPDVLETLQDAISIRLYIGSLAYEHARLDSHAPVLDGYHRCCPGRGASEIVPRPENITEREWQVMECVSRALSNHEIAKELALSEPTVKAHLRKVFRKVGATSRVDAINKVGLAG
jgi:DNA-binding CsgD family transcriptional regulator